MVFASYGVAPAVDWITATVQNINAAINPPSYTAGDAGAGQISVAPIYLGPGPTPGVYTTPAAPPLATIAGIDITPMRLVLGLAAFGALFYFAKRKFRS